MSHNFFEDDTNDKSVEKAAPAAEIEAGRLEGRNAVMEALRSGRPIAPGQNHSSS